MSRSYRPMLSGFAATLLGALLLSTSCTSRTLPLPPPEVSSVSRPNAAGRVTVTGLSLEGASVGIVNDRTLEGVIVTSPVGGCSSACPFEATVSATTGDGLRVFQFFETAGGREVLVPRD